MSSYEGVIHELTAKQIISKPICYQFQSKLEILQKCMNSIQSVTRKVENSSRMVSLIVPKGDARFCLTSRIPRTETHHVMKGATGPIEVRLHDIDRSDMKEIVKHTRRYVDDEKPSKVIEVTDTPTKTSKFLEILASSNKGFFSKLLGGED